MSSAKEHRRTNRRSADGCRGLPARAGPGLQAPGCRGPLGAVPGVAARFSTASSMAGFADLNLPQGSDKKSLQSLLETAAHCKYLPGHGGSLEGGGGAEALAAVQSRVGLSRAQPGGRRDTSDSPGRLVRARRESPGVVFPRRGLNLASCFPGGSRFPSLLSALPLNLWFSASEVTRTEVFPMPSSEESCVVSV